MAIAKKDKISFFQLEFQPFERIPFERHMVSQKKKKKNVWTSMPQTITMISWPY